MLQQQPRLPEVALDGALRDATQPGYLAQGVAAEEMEVHQLGERRLQRAELVERIRELAQLFGVGRQLGEHGRAGERDLERPAAALERA